VRQTLVEENWLGKNKYCGEPTGIAFHHIRVQTLRTPSKRTSYQLIPPTRQFQFFPARLCHVAGGELEQIQFLLGHVSVQTTERYLGSKQKIRDAVNDRIGIEPAE
jgi:hypothetical protein